MRKTGMQRLTKMAVALTLATSIAVTTVSPSYAVPRSASATVQVARKPNISKSSALYKALNKGLFDYEYYKANNPDVVAALGTSRQALLNHFVKYGIYEGRQPSADFNINAYSSAYGDLQAAFNGNGSEYQVILNYYNHYINYGMKEGREITTVEKANAAGITVTKVGTDTPVAGQNSSAPASVTYVAPAPSAKPAPTVTPAPAPKQEVVPAPDNGKAAEETIEDNNKDGSEEASKEEINNQEKPSQPEATPEKPEETVTEPEETPSQPEATPEESEETVTEPEEKPSQPEATPEKPEETVTEPENTPSEPETPAPHVHDYGEGNVVIMPSKETEGLKTFICECGDSYEEVIAKLTCAEAGHSNVRSVRYIKESTCTEDGSYVLICNDCGEQDGGIYTAPKRHTYNDNGTTTIYPTETTEGEITFVCLICGYEDARAVPAGHLDVGYRYCNFGKHGDTHLVWVTEPTCTTFGIYQYVCDLCGRWLRQGSEYGHVFGDTPEISVAPTTTHSGHDYYRCILCGNGWKNIYYDQLECVGMNVHGELVETVAKEATCTEDGYYNLVCCECNEIVEKGDVIPASGHDYVLIESIEATYRSEGRNYYRCSACNASDFKYTDRLECPHENTTESVKGPEKTTTCKDCGCKLNVEEVECAHEIKYGWTCVQECSEEQDGIYIKECFYCGGAADTKIYHRYKAYTVDIGNGETTTVYGWLESDYDDTVIAGEDSVLDHNSMYGQVFDKLNEYRLENGLNELEWNYLIQDAADLRAIEASVCWAHERPNGTKWNTVNSTFMHGENLASGHSNVDLVMIGWKNSEGHNRNMLYPTFRSVAVGTFHRYTFTEGSLFPDERIYWSQEFSYIG